MVSEHAYAIQTEQPSTPARVITGPQQSAIPSIMTFSPLLLWIGTDVMLLDDCSSDSAQNTRMFYPRRKSSVTFEDEVEQKNGRILRPVYILSILPDPSIEI